jgi:hypothetical protein
MNDQEIRDGLARMSKAELVEIAADLHRRGIPMRNPSELRAIHYPPLSALTKQTLGQPRSTIAQEIAAVESIIEYHERKDWQGISQEDYDTLYPDLTGYLATLQRHSPA